MSDNSDFSDYEDEDYGLGPTSVLLGFADDQITKSDSMKISPLDNHIGGQPVWLNASSPPSKELTACKNCGKQMALFVQIFAPLENTFYDRVLYVFGCVDSQCRRKEGTVRALRSVLRDEQKEQEEKKREEEKDQKQVEEKPKLFDFGGGAGGAEGSPNPFANPFAAAAAPAAAPAVESKAQSSATKQEEKEKKAAEEEQPILKEKTEQSGKSPKELFPELSAYYLCVEEEVLEKPKAPQVKVDESVIEREDGSSSSSGGGGATGGSSAADELEAAATAVNMDPAFQRFVDVVECNPEQVVRYGNPLPPLYYSSEDSVYKVLSQEEIPKDKDGNPRKLELQIMPHLIMLVEEEQSITEGMEWGTIYVGTSSSDDISNLDSNGVGYAEEWVGVQWEEELTVASDSGL